jgi:hypothetical protein
MNAMEMESAKTKFDTLWRRYITAGMHAKDAVPKAAEEAGIKLTKESEDNIIARIVWFLQNQTEEGQKRAALTQRLQMYARLGWSAERAVPQALDDLGITMSEAGQKALIDDANKRAVEINKMMAATSVVSPQQFQDEMAKAGVCIPFFGAKGQHRWQCCQCAEHNPHKEQVCPKCGHIKCGVLAT